MYTKYTVCPQKNSQLGHCLA